jgi:Glycosyl transferase family 2
MDDTKGLPRSPIELPVVAPTLQQMSASHRLGRRVNQLRPGRLLDELRSTIETRQDRHEIQQLRAGRDVIWPELANPLVTVRIATYSAGERLRVAIDSALRQTYENVEVLVIGDGCDEPTSDVAESYEHRGVRFLNLPRRGQYPSKPRDQWMVAGATPMNVGLELARGEWIAPCDDDDLITDDHVERLVAFAQSHRLEFVWSAAALQGPLGEWSRTAPDQLANGHISHGSVLMSSELRFLRYNRRSYLSGREADWELWRRMKRAGVRMGYLDALTYYHFA